MVDKVATTPNKAEEKTRKQNKERERILDLRKLRSLPLPTWATSMARSSCLPYHFFCELFVGLSKEGRTIGRKALLDLRLESWGMAKAIAKEMLDQFTQKAEGKRKSRKCVSSLESWSE